MTDATPALGQNKAARSSISTGQFILAMVILTLLAGALGVAFALRVAPPGETKKEAAGSAETNQPSPSATSSLIDLPPIITNLSAPQDTWVRLEVSMIFDPKTIPHPDALAAEIASDLLAYMRTLSLAQLEGPVGLANLRDDLDDRASIRSDGKVKELVLRTLVLQ